MPGEVGSSHLEGCEEGSEVISKLGGKRDMVVHHCYLLWAERRQHADKPLEFIL